MPVYTPVARKIGSLILPSGEPVDLIPDGSIGVDASNAAAIAVGAIIWRESDGNAALATDGASHSLLGMVTKVYDSQGNQLRDNYLAASTAGSLEFVAFKRGAGGVAHLVVSEDAVGGNVADSDTHIDLVQSVATTTAQTIDKGAYMIVQADTSEKATSSTNKLFEIKGPYGEYANLRQADDTTSPRTFRLAPISTKLQDP